MQCQYITKRGRCKRKAVIEIGNCRGPIQDESKSPSRFLYSMKTCYQHHCMIDEDDFFRYANEDNVNNDIWHRWL